VSAVLDGACFGRKQERELTAAVNVWRWVSDAAQIVKTIVGAVKYLHSYGIVHRGKRSGRLSGHERRVLRN
jgi:hypothetical protein